MIISLLNRRRISSAPSLPTDYISYSLAEENTWSNAVLKIRRSSDNATAFVFFDSGIVSTSSLISTTSNTTPDATTLGTWLSTDDAFVEEWIAQTYDDTINNNYIVKQTTTGEQPELASGGVIHSKNGKPAIDFLSTLRRLETTNGISAMDTSNLNSIVTVSAGDTSGSLGCICGTSKSVAQRLNMWNDRRVAGDLHSQVWASSQLILNTLSVHDIANQKLISITRPSTTTMYAYYNDVEQENGSYTGSYTNDTFRIGNQQTSSSPFKGTIQLVRIYESDVSADLADIHDDINTYYSIY